MPFMPSFLVNWHHKQFAISGGFFIIGGGSEAKFNDGLPAILSVGVSYAWLDWMGVEKDFFGHPRFAEWKKR